MYRFNNTPAQPKNVTDLLQVVNFTALLQFANLSISSSYNSLLKSACFSNCHLKQFSTSLHVDKKFW